MTIVEPARRSLLATLIAAAMLLSPSYAMAQERVDLELVLAVDASGSVDNAEFALQLGGIAAAFQSPDVQAAIARGPIGRIAVALTVWAAAELPTAKGLWFVIADPGNAAAFADYVARFPRTVGGGTGIGSGIGASVTHMDRNRFVGTRRVIDVSGDGRETQPRDYVVMMPQARQMADARGITINGLAILNEDPMLERYYREAVITGPGAFVMSVAGFEDFADAIRRKLVREIEGLPNVAIRHGPSPTGGSGE